VTAADELELEAARCLGEALELLRARGARHHHRTLLARAVDAAERALEAGGEKARTILAKAHAARAEDARHGAGQLSLGAQRAPTVEACDDGWRRVEEIVETAERAARAAADAGGSHAGRAAAAHADAAARAARKIVEERNHAYTFHTDPRFSFGEGWYVAAAGVLSGVAIQIEPGVRAALAERFLRDANVGDRLAPYRSRPRANKQTTAIVARAFREDPTGAQARLRAAFLGDAEIAEAVRVYVDRTLAGAGDRKKVLLWIRDAAHHAGRNTAATELHELASRVVAAGMLPVLVGDALRDGAMPAGAADLILFWKDPVFAGHDGRRAQLQLFEHLCAAHGTVGQLGVTTAGMDGPALMGMPTMYLTAAPNPRMGAWVGAVPGYREIVRENGYLERVSACLGEWAACYTS
jgi:hypothetical protein